MAQGNILYVGNLNGVQVDFSTGRLTDVTTFANDVRNTVIVQTITDGVTGSSPSSDAIWDLVTGASGYLAYSAGGTYSLNIAAGGSNDATLELNGVGISGGTTQDTISISGGTGIVVTENGQTVAIAHADTSAFTGQSWTQANGEVFQDLAITLDNFGHVVDFTVGTLDLDDRYYTETEIDSKFTNSGNWQTGYGRSITGASFAGTTTKTLTLNRQDGGTIQASFNDDNTTYTAASGVTLDGTTFIHTDTSSQASITSIAGQALNSLTLDTYGHVTAATTGAFLIAEADTLATVTARGGTTYSLAEFANGLIGGQVIVGVDYPTTVRTTASDLLLDSAGGNVRINDNLYVQGNTFVGGNLVVSGTTTSIESTVTTLNDPIISLGSGTIAADDGKDRGIQFIYYKSAIRTGFLGWDNQNDRFVGYTGATNNEENFAGVPAPFDLSKTVDNATIEYVDGSSYLQVKNGGIGNVKLANSSVTVTAGNGLTDGGAVALGSSVSLNVGAGYGIDVSADAVAVDTSEVVVTTGSQTIGGTKTFSSTIQGLITGASTALNALAVENGILFANGLTPSPDAEWDGSAGCVVSTDEDQNHLSYVNYGGMYDAIGSYQNKIYGGMLVGRAYYATTPVELTDDGAGSYLIPVPSMHVVAFEGVVCARSSANPNLDAKTAAWNIRGLVHACNTTTTMVGGQVTEIAKGASAGAWGITMSAATNGVSVQVSGTSGDPSFWSAFIKYTVISGNGSGI